MNITLIGMPGAGKSYVGKKLAEHLEYALIELDTLTEEKFRLPLQQILDMLGEKMFLEVQEKEAIEYTESKNNLIISPGGSIIYSDKAMNHLKNISKIIYLKTSLETIQKRIQETPRGIVGLKEKTLEQLYAERTILYEKWADVVADGEKGVNEVIQNIKTNMI